MANFAILVLSLVTMSMYLTLSTAAPTDVIPGAAYNLKNFDEKYTAVLKEMGYADDIIKLIQNQTISVIRVAKDGDKYITNFGLTLCEKVPEDTKDLKSGEEYDLTLCDGRKLKAIIEYKPDSMKLTRTIKMDGFNSTQCVFQVSEAGMKVHYKVKDKEVDLDFVPHKP